MRSQCYPVLLFCLTALLFYCHETPLYGQDSGVACGPPPATATIITSDGLELELTFRESAMRSVSMNSVNILGDGFSVSISFDQEDENSTPRISINDGAGPYDWGRGRLEISSGHGGQPWEEPIDTTCLPPEYAELWTRLQAICGELVESEEFWELIGIENEAARLSLREDMERLRDGYFVPSAYSQEFSIQFTIGRQFVCDGQLGRGYTLYGPLNLQVITPSAPDDNSPDLYLGNFARLQEDRWIIHVDPACEICAVSWGAGDPTQPLSEDEWLPAVYEIRDALEFYYGQIPALIEGGILEPDSELEFLLEKSLHGLASYTYELGYTNECISGTSDELNYDYMKAD